MPYEALTAPLTLRGKTLKTRLLYPVAQPHFCRPTSCSRMIRW